MMMDWIPVEEKLPQNHDLVIVTHEIDGNYYVNEAEFEDGAFFDTMYTDDMEDYEMPNVIAWMPYPTPYIRRTNNG